MFKKQFGILLLLSIILFGNNAHAQTPIPCNSTLWQHVYHSYRLKVIEECKTVTGIVEAKKREKDGDWHIRLRLDDGQEGLLNEKNISEQHGCLVIEIICACEVTQTDAIGSCQGFLNNVKVPEVGEHVSVTGSYVNDGQHGWNEIHPITSIVALDGSAGISSSREVKTQPAPSNYANNGKYVYLCSGSSQVYHLDPNCSGLKRCQYQIIRTTVDSAEGYYHRRACKECGR